MGADWGDVSEENARNILKPLLIMVLIFLIRQMSMEMVEVKNLSVNLLIQLQREYMLQQKQGGEFFLMRLQGIMIKI